MSKMNFCEWVLDLIKYGLFNFIVYVEFNAQIKLFVSGCVGLSLLSLFSCVCGVREVHLHHVVNAKFSFILLQKCFTYIACFKSNQDIMFNATVFLAKTPTMLLSRRQVGKILTLAKIYESQRSLLCTGNIKKRTTILSVKKSNTESKNVINTSSGLQEPSSISGSLTTQQAQELALRLTSDERQCLVKALQEFESKLIKDEYEGKNVMA